MNNLHQLLTDARGDLPPTTVDLEEVAARGRRHIRRRRWSVVAAAVAVTLGAGSLFPFVRGGHRPPAQPAPASSGSGFAARLQGWPAGDYRVGASIMTTPGYEIAPISRVLDGVTRVVGSVEVYHPGVFDPHVVRTGTPVTIGPIAGFRITATTTIKYAEGDQKLATLTRTSVAWPYADNAWAVVRSAADGATGGMTPESVQQVAAGFRLGAAAPVRLPFRVGYVPAGLSMQAAGRVSLDFARDPTLGRLGEVTLAQPRSFTALTGPVTLGGVTIVEERRPDGVPRGATACDDHGCYRGLPGTDLYLGVTGKIPAAELRKVLEGLTTAPPADESTWFPVQS